MFSLSKNQHRSGRRLSLVTLLAVVVAAACGGCATMTDLTQVRRPEVAVKQVQFKNADFEAVDLVFDLTVDNPNAMPILLAGLDYGLIVGGQKILSGAKRDALRIDSRSTGTVALPVRLGWSSLAAAVKDARAQDAVDYTLDSALSFNLPVLGAITVPVSKSGQLPVVKAPSINVVGLTKNSVNLTGADLVLLLDVENPNAFHLALSQLSYGFKVNGQNWASGSHPANMSVPARGTGRIAIPMTLNFLEVGRAAFSLVSGSQPLRYEFDGNTVVGTSLPMLNKIPWTIARAGEVQVLSAR